MKIKMYGNLTTLHMVLFSLVLQSSVPHMAVYKILAVIGQRWVQEQTLV